MSSVPEFGFTIRAREFGELVLIAFDGDLPENFDRLRLKQSRKVVAETNAAAMVSGTAVSFLPEAQGGAAQRRFLNRLAAAFARDDSAAVLILPYNPETNIFELSFLRGRSRLGGTSLFSARAVGAIAGMPVGNVISTFAAGAPCPIPVLDDCDLPLVDSEYFHGVAGCSFRIPADLFDGEAHDYALAPEQDDVERAGTEWACHPTHIFYPNRGPTRSRGAPSPFPDHEVGRVSAFADRPAAASASPDPLTIAAWQAGQSVPSCPPLRLFVFDMTLKGALATPAALQLHALHRDWLETCVVLPTVEAARFGAETSRDSGVSQYVDIVAIDALGALIAAQPDDAVIVAVPGGSELTQAALDEIYAIMAGASTGLCSAVTHRVSAASLTLSVTENGEAPLDLARGAAIFSKKAALARLAFSISAHEGAIVPRSQLTEPVARRIAELPQAMAPSDSAALCCVIDAQAIAAPDRLLPVLEILVAGSVSVILIAAHGVARTVSATPGLKSVRTIVAPYDVWPEFEGELFRDRDRPVINISFDLLDLLAEASDDPVAMLASAVRYTTASSICTLANGDDTALGYFRCAKVPA